MAQGPGHRGAAGRPQLCSEGEQLPAGTSFISPDIRASLPAERGPAPSRVTGATEPCEAVGAGGRPPRRGCRGAGCPRWRWGLHFLPAAAGCHLQYGLCAAPCRAPARPGLRERWKLPVALPRHRAPAQHHHGTEKGSCAGRGAKAGKSTRAASTPPHPGLGHSEPPSPGTPGGGTQGLGVTPLVCPGTSAVLGTGSLGKTFKRDCRACAQLAASTVCAGYSPGKSLQYSNMPAQVLPVPRPQHAAHGAAPRRAGTHGMATARAKSRAAPAAPGRAGGAAGDRAFLVPPRRGG